MSPAMERYQAILEAAKNLVAAQKATEKAGAARHALPLGSTRARVTTANARWARHAEERDRCERELEKLVAGASLTALRVCHDLAAEATGNEGRMLIARERWVAWREVADLLGEVIARSENYDRLMDDATRQEVAALWERAGALAEEDEGIEKREAELAAARTKSQGGAA